MVSGSPADLFLRRIGGEWWLNYERKKRQKGQCVAVEADSTKVMEVVMFPPRRMGLAEELRRTEERKENSDHASGATRKGGGVPDHESQRRARREQQTHEDLVLAVAVEMGELTVHVDPATGKRYYARTGKDSPLFGSMSDVSVTVRRPGCSSRRVRRPAPAFQRAFFTMPRNKRLVIFLLMGISLVKAIWADPRAVKPARPVPGSSSPGLRS